LTVLLVAVGAMVGAPLRYLVDRFIQARHDSLFPWGTFTVNLVGCFVLGALAGARALPGWVLTLCGTGFCGALTTYSTFGYETVRLVQERARLIALVNVVASLGAGLAAAYLGLGFAELFG
jgi:fluoride exporter